MATDVEAVCDREGWRLVYGGRLCRPYFGNKGAALAYGKILDRGDRTPEYVGDVDNESDFEPDYEHDGDDGITDDLLMGGQE